MKHVAGQTQIKQNISQVVYHQYMERPIRHRFEQMATKSP